MHINPLHIDYELRRKICRLVHTTDILFPEHDGKIEPFEMEFAKSLPSIEPKYLDDVYTTAELEEIEKEMQDKLHITTHIGNRTLEWLLATGYLVSFTDFDDQIRQVCGKGKLIISLDKMDPMLYKRIFINHIEKSNKCFYENPPTLEEVKHHIHQLAHVIDEYNNILFGETQHPIVSYEDPDLVSRNESWISHLLTFDYGNAKTASIICGSAHCNGEDSLLDTLRRRGIVVTREKI